MYEGLTPRGNPVNQKLHQQFQMDMVNRQTQGQPGWNDYDHWYDEVVKPQQQEQPNGLRGQRGWK
jgi:hypothetical protein